MGFLEDQGATSGAALGADPLFPLAANPEQRQIMTRLRGDNGVVVQGPPGTGKTHTIANLVAALLAQGQRVLVTSQKAQALRVLREKLPKDVAKLCISITDQRRGGSAELEGSVQALSSRFEKYSAEKYERELGQLRQRRADARREEATLVERIRSLREAETYQHDEIAPAYRGRLADIAERLKREAPACDWMPVPLPARASGTPPINATESAELVRLLADETAQRRARTSQLLPEVTTLPPVETVRGLVAAEAAATDSARQAETDLSRRLAACSLDLLARLEETAGAVAAALDHLDLSDDPGLWEQSDWVVRAVTSGLAQQEMFIWEQLHAHQPRVEEARSAMRTLGLRRVALPPFAPSGDESEASQLAAALRLRDYLAGGGKLKRGLFKPAVQRQAEPLLTGALVDGVSPTTVELLSIVIAELEGRAACAELSHGWRLVGVDIPVDQPVPAVVGRISDQYARLDLVMQVWAGVRQATELLAAAMIPVRLATPSRWREYVVALRAVRLRLEADHASSELQTLRERLDLEVAKGMAPPELVAAVVALAGRDIEAYGQCVAALATAHLELREQSRCDDLHERLNAVHPALATRMSRTRTDEEWPERLANWDRAWAWGKAQTFFTAQRQPGLERQLDGILEAATQQVLNVSAKLAAEQAWSICLSRMTSHHAQALRSYQQHMKDFGGGTGRYASRFRRLAREAMAEAAPAVPAWIMPLRQVLETMPPTRDSFDVVIVDEASQASIEALFLLWLAPRVIVVGDDKQCAPSVVSHGELQPLFDKLGTYLPDVPGYLRDAFTPNSSLFDLLGTRFGSVIRLREHFRCMPEIIEYSSRQFYPDEPLVPLRQFGADRLPPLQVVHAPGASTDGTGVRIRNETEAAEIVNQIVACLDDPAYEGKTFGVVVLQGSGQAQLIQNLLLERIATTEWDQRKLRVGTPPDFQGDERDVIFLSMVIAEKRSAITKLEFQRRFNVAASRAKDQMWLFHSVSPDILSPTDLRKSLLTYMLNPPAPFAASTLDDVVADVPYGPPFDSVFEQRVFLRIRERGYHVTPQVEVNGRRIDLVVSGAKGRLAVECDGDHWHTSPEDRENDLDRERELKRAGWKFWRVRESEFYFDPDAALTTLWDELDRRGIHPGEALKEQTEVPTSSWSAVRLPEDEDGSPGDDAESQDEELPPPVAPSPTETRTRQRTGTSAGGKRKAFPTAPVELRLVEQIALPVDVPDIEPDFDSARNDLPLTPGRTAPGYSRSELQALLRWVAGDGQRRSEDDLLATAADVLNSPSPRDQVRTLLRSALRHMLRN
nr:AAA domain-containing protein [Actinopolymorpha rutila]